MVLILRPFAEADLGYFDRPPEAETDPFSFFRFRAGRGENRTADQLLADSGATLAIDVDSTVVGDVQWHIVPYGPPPMSNAFNIGIRLEPSHQGQGHGTRAQVLLVRYLLMTYPVNRIEASTDVTNKAEQRALEKAGFTREGVLRGAQWRAGRWNDLLSYAYVREDGIPAS